jgi:CheY-like chemotaxis protein
VHWGYDVVVVSDGDAAWQAMSQPDAPALAILDWMMPGMDGTEICRRVREKAAATSTYIILLTTKDAKDDIVAGLRAGADDYLTKPFDVEELRARVQVGVRLVELQQKLADRVNELAEALAEVKKLHGLLPICAWCRKIRDDSNYWQEIETYVVRHLDTQFSHGICPDCFAKVRPPEKGKGP